MDPLATFIEFCKEKKEVNSVSDPKIATNMLIQSMDEDMKKFEELIGPLKAYLKGVTEDQFQADLDNATEDRK